MSTVTTPRWKDVLYVTVHRPSDDPEKRGDLLFTRSMDVTTGQLDEEDRNDLTTFWANLFGPRVVTVRIQNRTEVIATELHNGNGVYLDIERFHRWMNKAIVKAFPHIFA